MRILTLPCRAQLVSTAEGWFEERQHLLEMPLPPLFPPKMPTLMIHLKILNLNIYFYILAVIVLKIFICYLFQHLYHIFARMCHYMSSAISPLVSHSLLCTGLLHLGVPANPYLPACALPSPLLLIFTGCPGVVAGGHTGWYRTYSFSIHDSQV